MIDRLVQQGYLERFEDPDDRRMKTIRLTAKGQTQIQESIEARRAWMEELTKVLTPEQQERIITSLILLTDAAYELEREKTADWRK